MFSQFLLSLKALPGAMQSPAVVESGYFKNDSAASPRVTSSCVRFDSLNCSKVQYIHTTLMMLQIRVMSMMEALNDKVHSSGQGSARQYSMG